MKDGKKDHLKTKNSKKAHARIQTSVKDEALVEKRRRQICEAALQAFTRNGFHETNLRQVTKLADLAYGSIYDYVRTKDDILFLIYDNILSELCRVLQEAAESSDEPVGQLQALIRAAMDHTDEYKEAIILLYQESRVMKTSGHMAEVYEKERSYLRIFIEVLERGAKLGMFDFPNIRVLENILPLICSAWALKRWNLKGVSKEEYAEGLINFVFHGISAVPRVGSGTGSKLEEVLIQPVPA
jgi:AcrR family transcriptional regulator